MTFMIALCVALFGVLIGSFLNVLIIRLPQEETIGGRSHCVTCGHELSALELVPIFSYLALKGKCKNCGKRISPRYILIELVTGILFLITYLVFKNLVSADLSAGWIILIRALFICALMVVIFVIDLEHYLILDKVLLFGGVILLFLNALIDFVHHASFSNSYTGMGFLAGLGLFLFFGMLHLFSKGRWMGLGDVKFSWVLGFALPFPLIIVGTFLAFFVGSIVGVILIARGDKTLASRVPFGTFLSLGAVVTLWWGPQILNWYLGLLGWK